jgi:hypothetical protein
MVLIRPNLLTAVHLSCDRARGGHEHTRVEVTADHLLDAALQAQNLYRRGDIEGSTACCDVDPSLPIPVVTPAHTIRRM